MKSTHTFDVIIQSDKKIVMPEVKNIAELVFKKLPHRNEKCDIIWSHDNDTFIKISLIRLRYIVTGLFEEFKKKDLKPGETVILTDLMVNNCYYIALMFTALTAYGCRVLLPMWIETSEISTWIKITNCKAVIAPEKEVNSLDKHEIEKQIIKEIKSCANKNMIQHYDIENDFNISSYLKCSIPENFSIQKNQTVEEIIKNTNPSTEMAVFTTSGTTGRSKLVVYSQGAYLAIIAAHKSSGLYEKNKIGGRCYIDIFTHTVSIRNYFHALWMGYPVCMVILDWIKEKPEKVLPLLMEMKPEVITVGPSSFNVIIDFIKIFPEIKKIVFSELKTIISTGAPYSKITAEKYKNTTGLILHNAFGLSETQQFLTTILCDNFFDPSNPCLGAPIAGVTVGLKKFIDDTYKLYVKTPFGHKYILDPTSPESLYPDEFFDTGDIVQIDAHQNIYYIGREKLDYFKNGFGIKIPISSMKQYYKKLYERANHIEYYAAETLTFNLGVAALIFIDEQKIPKERVMQRNVIEKYTKIIKKINGDLYTMIEPFEYENRAITRFLLLNMSVPKTHKNTISKYIIETKFKNEIDDLKRSNSRNTGIKNILRPKQIYFNILQKILPMENATFRKLLLKIITRKRNIQ